MEGPFDPQHPGQDASASQPEDGDLHALLERLLGQGDVRPSAPGAGDDLWPDLFAATPVADEVSTIIPAAETPTAVAEQPDADEPMSASVELAATRAWEPIVVDSAATSTNVDDIHAAILASVSVELQPLVADAPAAAAPSEPAVVEQEFFHHVAGGPDLPAVVDHDPEPMVLDVVADVESSDDVFTVDVPADALFAESVADTAAFDALALEAFDALAIEAADAPEPVATIAPTAAADELGATFALTPFEVAETEPADDSHPDADALWAAAVPELGLDVAPLLDLDPVDVDPSDEPVAVTAVVLPWPTHEPKTTEPVAPSPHDLIEAALAGLHADLTSEPVEPLRTPDVAVSTAHVVFHLGTRTMAIPLAAVSEIARPPKVTRLPHVPAWVLGIANLRGDIVSMLDLEGFFSGKAGKSSHEQRMLALRPAGDEVRTAVLVDSVDGIQAFEDARIARVTRGYDAEVAPYARGLYQLEDDLVVVLDADRLLQSKPMRQFEDGAGAR
ncbi:MAG: chemotaxis protein CheW [Vicinamibacteraceae bacterium]